MTDEPQPGQTLAQSTARILSQLEPVLAFERPDMVLVQGDTTTTLSGALGAFYQQIPVGHVEAGLRTGDLAQPFPEEMNRVVTTRLATLHFAPTPLAAGRLSAEGVAADHAMADRQSVEQGADERHVVGDLGRVLTVGASCGGGGRSG